MWFQKTISLKPRTRGFHLITTEVLSSVPEIKQFQTGICHLFLQHTSASLTLNENADPTVRVDFESHFNRLVPEGAAYFRHTLEGPDDMTAHIKSSLLGVSITVPVASGQFNLGTWQGIYLCEHRNQGGSRRLVITIHGE